jgi:hypothetical protein
MTRYCIAAAAAAALLTGCASDPLRYPATTAPLTPAAERETSLIFLRSGRCSAVEKGEAAGSAIAGALIGVGVDFAVKLAAGALKRMKEGRNAIWVASAATSALQPKTDDQAFCATLARGVLIPVPAEDAVVPRSLGFRDQPIFLLKLDLTLGALSKAPAAPAPTDKKEGNTPAESVFLTAKPYELRYADTSAPVRGSGRKNVSVVLALSPQTLQPTSGETATPDTSKAAVLRLDFGRLQTGRVFDQKLLSTVSAVTSFPKAANTTLTAVVSETEKPSAALEAFVAAFESNQSDLSSALKKTIKEAVGAGEE